MRSIGKRGARSSGPIGSLVLGWRGGGGGSGRSGTRLYQAWGISDSSRVTLVTSAIEASLVAWPGRYHRRADPGDRRDHPGMVSNQTTAVHTTSTLASGSKSSWTPSRAIAG